MSEPAAPDILRAAEWLHQLVSQHGDMGPRGYLAEPGVVPGAGAAAFVLRKIGTLARVAVTLEPARRPGVESVEIVAPPPEQWPDRIIAIPSPKPSALLLSRDNLIVGSVRFSDQASALAGVTAALGALGYLVEPSGAGPAEFRRVSRWHGSPDAEPAQRFDRSAAVSHDLNHAHADLDAVAHHPDVVRRWPRLAQALANLGQRLALAGYALEVNAAAEGSAERDAGVEAVLLRQLLQALDAVLPESGT